MLIDDPDLNEIFDVSKNTHENKRLFGVLTMFESSVSHVSHDDFALQIESKESMKEKKEKVCDQCCRVDVKERSTERV